ncbi:MAG: T9SS type A sorting domain-containing protein [Sphingobacteriales bacterium]|nr:MAG: T9SS type A sorting domain-containing protein [Sphingobacteriales bacterium]
MRVLLNTTLTHFQAQAEGPVNQLSWTVVDRATGTHFTVERSATGTDFISIGTVTGSNASQYAYTDAASGTTYYRLQLTETSGKISYSPVVWVRRSNEAGALITVAPQPVRDFFTVSHTDSRLAGTMATVINIQGQLVDRFEIRDGVQIDASRWLPSIYLVRLANGEVLRISKN